MGERQRWLPIVGILVAGAAAFGVGAYVMGGSQKEVEAPPAAGASVSSRPQSDTPKAKTPTTDVPGAKPRAEAQGEQPQPAPPRLDPRIYDPKTNLPIPQKKTVRGKWETMSGYALPNPRKLTDNEKAALNLLAGAVDIQGYGFSGTTLDDGSSIPGLPALNNAEIREIVLGRIRAKGLADGFEEAIRSIAVHNPNQLTVIVSQDADWTAVAKALGIQTELKPEKGAAIGWRHDGKIQRFHIQWISSGWLRFGVDAGKVKMIRAEFGGTILVSYPEYIAAEDVPGGRSDPDPSKALKKSKPRPTNAPPRPVETLQKLGTIQDIKVVPGSARKESPALRTLAEELAGKPLYPDMFEAAQKCKGQLDILEFLITPSATMSVDDMTDIMTDSRMRRDDSRTFPGLTVKWYNYYWLELGIVDGQVKKVRVHCQMMPKKL